MTARKVLLARRDELALPVVLASVISQAMPLRSGDPSGPWRTPAV